MIDWFFNIVVLISSFLLIYLHIKLPKKIITLEDVIKVKLNSDE